MLNKQKLNLEALTSAIKIAGGISSLAIKSNVSYQSIIDWKNGRKSPSTESCIKIEQAVEGKVTRQEILPDYPWEKTKIDGKRDLEIAKNLLTAGIDIETIAKTTGLSIEELENIRS